MQIHNTRGRTRRYRPQKGSTIVQCFSSDTLYSDNSTIFQGKDKETPTARRIDDCLSFSYDILLNINKPHNFMCTHLSRSSSLADRTYGKIRIGQNQTGAKNEVLFKSKRFLNLTGSSDSNAIQIFHHKLMKQNRQNFTKKDAYVWLLLSLFLDRIRTQIMMVIYERRRFMKNNFQIFDSDRKKLHMNINQSAKMYR